ncbi:hypothetical protein GGF32_007426, partial [Allomyces javanicus]
MHIQIVRWPRNHASPAVDLLETDVANKPADLRDRVAAVISSPSAITGIDALYCQPLPRMDTHQIDVILEKLPLDLHASRLDERAVIKVLTACLVALRDNSAAFINKLDQRKDQRKDLLSLIRKLVAWDNYSVAAGAPLHGGSEILSFQRVLVPLLYVLGHSEIATSTMQYNTNMLLSTVPTALDELLTNVVKCVQDVLKSNGGLLMDETHRLGDMHALAPLSLAQVIAPVVQVLDMTFKRFPTVALCPSVVHMCELLDATIMDWATRVREGLMKSIESDFAVAAITKRWQRVQLAFGSSALLDTILAQKRQRESQIRTNDGAKAAMRFDDWRNDQLLAPTGVHDNDAADFRDIAIEQVDLMAFVGVSMTQLDFHKHAGVCISVAFALPRRALGSDEMRAKFWDHCLPRDGLVALVWPVTAGEFPYTVIFATVAEVDSNQVPGEDGFVTIKLGFGGHDFDAALFDRDANWLAYMIEARTLMFEAYRPVLKALQEKRPGNIPFADLLCPPTPPATEPHVDLPLYAKVSGMRFDLSYLIAAQPDADGAELAEQPTLHLDPADVEDRARVVDTLVAQSTLDASQAKALIGALTSEVCCIQGPPGTGKSFIGVKYVEVLHKHKDLSLAPIVVLCYTNHALDQFLEALLDLGITNLVRVGSKPSDRLREYTPRRSWFAMGGIMDLEKKLESLGDMLTTARDAEVAESIASDSAWDVLKNEFPHVADAIQYQAIEWDVSGSAVQFWLEGRDLSNVWRNAGKKKGKTKIKSAARLALRDPKAQGGNLYELLAASTPASATVPLPLVAPETGLGYDEVVEKVADKMDHLKIDSPDQETHRPFGRANDTAWRVLTARDAARTAGYTVWDLDLTQRQLLAEYIL